MVSVAPPGSCTRTLIRVVTVALLTMKANLKLNAKPLNRQALANARNDKHDEPRRIQEKIL
jgi:hypothetical protein